ncbi:MAG: MATE family efflux transporter [Bacteroidales bacterium]|jgi:putative MATE family efflux protein|nr:MATE family efflux transporter [Bacteroidales bacterium]MCI2121547.1 MATE family efflux transporter [Bacteroidales bacterium]MCI2145422.1 MATE family efflux transporter [Bacteroidales bacterium]
MAEDKLQEKYVMMTTLPVDKLVNKMSVPTIISMLVSAFYNMVDTIFCGHLDTQSTAAIGIAFSYMAIIQALGFYFGHGSGNFISVALGSKDYKNASKMAATGFYTALVAGVALGTAGLIFLKPISSLLGATETVLPYAMNYMKFIMIGTPFIMTSFVLNNQLRLQGNAMSAMVGLICGGVLNVILDPIFIFGLKMGVMGASLATAISQFVGFVLLMAATERKGSIHIRLHNFTPTRKMYNSMISGGLPSLGRQGLAGVAALLLNRAVSVFGDSALAAFSVVMRIVMIEFATLLGFGQGFQPVCGFNFGAKLYDRVNGAFRYTLKAGGLIFIALGIVNIIFAPQLISIFRSEDAELIRIGAQTLRFQSLAFPAVSFVSITSMLLQTTNRAVPATILAMTRQGIVFIPILLLSSKLWGLTGIELSQPISDVISFFIGIVFYEQWKKRFGVGKAI